METAGERSHVTFAGGGQISGLGSRQGLQTTAGENTKSEGLPAMVSGSDAHFADARAQSSIPVVEIGCPAILEGNRLSYPREVTAKGYYNNKRGWVVSAIGVDVLLPCAAKRGTSFVV